MSMKRISFIEAGAPGLHIFSKFPVARVGTVLLSTIPNLGANTMHIMQSSVPL